MKEQGEQRVEARFKQVQSSLMLLFVTMIFFVAICIVTIVLHSSNQMMRERVISLMSVNSGQLEVSIDAYLNKVETTVALFFSDETNYRYDATDESIDEYTRVKTEESIKDRIVDLGLMENFADFGVVYANDHTVGWVSRRTDEMFSDGGMYQAFADCITDEVAQSGWAVGLAGWDRIYYVKRLNANALLFTSFYSRELESTLQYVDDLEDTTIRLLDSSGSIIYSSLSEEIGGTLPASIADCLTGESNQTVMDDDYLITTKLCGNTWRIVWATPTRVLLKGTTQLTIYALLIAFGACVVFMLIGMLIIDRITRPMDGMVSDLAVMADVDQLAGVLNKITFQNKVERRAGDYDCDRCLVYIMMDADNFKQINDRLGHAYGDQVIIRIAQVLKQIFEGNALIGRVGGDEFSIFMETPNSTRADAMQHAANYMERVYAAYAQEFAKERAECGLSLSAGVCVMRDEAGMDFDKLYRRADAALYYSKRGGKNRYTLYREDMGDEQAANQ